MKVEEILISEIEHLENSRQKGFTNEDLSGLMQSIKNDGLMQPIGVTKIQGKLVIVWGNRRLDACKKLGYKTIPAVIVDTGKELTEDEFLMINTAENIQRREISMLEFGRVCKHFHEKMSYSEIAVRLGVPRTRVESAIKQYDNVPTQIQEKVKLFQTGSTTGRGRDGQIPFTIASAIADLRNLTQKQKIELYEEARKEELQTGQIRSISSFMKNGSSFKEAINEAKSYRPVSFKLLIEKETAKQIINDHGSMSKYMADKVNEDYKGSTLEGAY